MLARSHTRPQPHALQAFTPSLPNQAEFALHAVTCGAGCREAPPARRCGRAFKRDCLIPRPYNNCSFVHCCASGGKARASPAPCHNTAAGDQPALQLKLFWSGLSQELSLPCAKGVSQHDTDQCTNGYSGVSNAMGHRPLRNSLLQPAENSSCPLPRKDTSKQGSAPSREVSGALPLVGGVSKRGCCARTPTLVHLKHAISP